MFEKLWHKLRGESEEDEPQDERRAHPRHSINFDSTCELVNERSGPMEVRVRDISRGGIKFLIATRLEPGALVRIKLPLTDGPAEVLACVMHSTAQSDGTFAAGCAFSDELGDVELRHFGGRKETAHPSDKRTFQRFPAHGYAEYVVLPPTGAPAKKAEIANISATGIGLFVAEKIEPGAILDLLLQTKSGEQRFDILACAVYLGAKDGGWVVGCHFIRELDENDLNRIV